MAAALQPLLQGGEEGAGEFSLDYIWYSLAYYMLVYCRFIPGARLESLEIESM